MPIDPEELAASLRTLRHGGDDPDLLHALTAAVAACVEIFDVAGCGVMIADEHQLLRHVMSSDAPGHALEDVESAHGEGPCTDAFVFNVLTSTADLAADERWPRIAAAVVPRGVRAVLGLPLRLGGVPLGTLDVYRHVPHEWDATELAALHRYGELIEIVLGSALSAQRAGALTEQLQYALDHRMVIERAVGFLMARDGLDPVSAFNRLRRTARDQRRKIGAVAGGLVGERRPPDEAER